MKKIIGVLLMLSSTIAAADTERVLRRVTCTAVDAAGKEFTATKLFQVVAERAALRACQKAGGANCQIKTCARQ